MIAISNNIKSDAINEIITNKPSFIVSYGITIFFVVLCFVVAICWCIQYPDIVQAKAKLTSINAPKPVVVNSTGKLVKLFVKENDTVSTNQVIGFVEATGNHEEVLSLNVTIKNILGFIQSNQSQLIENELQTPLNNLGELQSSYQTFTTAFLVYKNYLSKGFYIRKKTMLAVDMVKYKALNKNLYQQKGLSEQDVNLATKNFEANQSLNNDKVIADVEFRNESSKLIGKKLTLPQITSSIINNEMQQNEKVKEIAELENTIAQQKIVFLQAINTFKSQVDEWVKKYVLVAPLSGNIAFATFVQENQQLQQNQILCYVNLQNSVYYAEVNIPQANFGKIADGQKVLLKLPSYPFQEYGAVIGKVDFISHIPTDSGYSAKVLLPNGLHTNYKKVVQFRDGLTASAEIVTKDMRLLQRFYYNFVKK